VLAMFGIKNHTRLITIVVAFVIIASLIVYSLDAVNTYINHHIWTCWVALYVFSLIGGFLFSDVYRRWQERFTVRLGMSFFISLLACVLCVVFALYQGSPIFYYYSLNGLIDLLIVLSSFLTIVGAFLVFK
jgi:DMSO reductase anchor subunit